MDHFNARPLRTARLSFLTICSAVLVLAGCSEGSLTAPTDPALLSAGAPSFAEGSRVSICHLQGNGTYNLITINSNALSAHEAHGDLPVGAAVPGGDVTLDAECVPRRDVTGTYTLRSLGDDHELPVLGTGELIHSMEIVLNADGSCSISGYFQGDQDDPDGVIEYFAFASCSYSLDGTELTFTLGDGEGGEFSMTVPLVGDQITLQIRIWNEAEGTTEEDAPFGDAVFVKV